MRIDLKHPFDLKDVTVTGVELRRPKARDMVTISDHIPALMKLAPKEGEEVDVSKFDGSIVVAMIAIVGALSDLPVGGAEELDFEDLVELAPQAIGFLSGPTSSGGA